MKQAIIVNEKYISSRLRDLVGKTFPVIDEFDRTILLNINDKERAPYGLQVLREAVKYVRKR
jgi:hypothetical protein